MDVASTTSIIILVPICLHGKNFNGKKGKKSILFIVLTFLLNWLIAVLFFILGGK